MTKEVEVKKEVKEKVVKAPKEAVKKENPKARWYVLNIRTGYENSIQKELKQRIEATGMENQIVDIFFFADIFK